MCGVRPAHLRVRTCEGLAMSRRLFSHIKNALTAAPLAFRPGHYYSPICDPKNVARRFKDPGLAVDAISGIDLNREIQLARWRRWASHINEFKWDRYRPDNS